MVAENSIDHAIRVLHEQGFTITETMKVLISEYGMSLREAKQLVSTHPVWKAVTKAAEPLHDDLIKIWKEEETQGFDKQVS